MLEMVVVIVCLVTIAVGQLPPGAQRTWAQTRPCSAGPSCLSQEAWLCEDTAMYPHHAHSHPLGLHWCFLSAAFSWASS